MGPSVTRITGRVATVAPCNTVCPPQSAAKELLAQFGPCLVRPSNRGYESTAVAREGPGECGRRAIPGKPGRAFGPIFSREGLPRRPSPGSPRGQQPPFVIRPLTAALSVTYDSLEFG